MPEPALPRAGEAERGALVRASDAERERTADLLRQAAAEGRLTFEELADRIGAALGARTRGELDRLTEDLPVLAGGAPAAAAVAPASASAVFGDVRRSGRWLVPVESRWKSFFGDVVIDLREAQVPSAEVVIDAGSVFGEIDLLVPEGIAVEVRARSVLGGVEQEVGGLAPAGAPRVVLTGRTVFGDVRVRSRRLRERLVEALSRGT